jgi:hypothetical protein
MPDDLLNIDGEYFYQGRRNTEVNDDETLSLLKEQLVDYSVVKTDKAKYLVVWDKPDLDYVTARSGIQLLFEGPIHLNKEDFFIDTKISMEQLRAYLDHNYLPKEDYGGLKQVWNDNEKSN